MKTILLDAGGVLVWPNWQRVAETLGRHGVAADADALAMADPRARHALDAAEIISGSDDQGRGLRFFNLVLTNAGVPLNARTSKALADIQEYHRVSNLWEHMPDFVEPALRALRTQGHRLGIVSNSNGTLRVALDRLGLTALFDAIIDSADEGIEKPDPELFGLALRRIGATPGEAIHVGDMYHVDVVGARAAGISAVLVDEANLHPNADCPRIRSVAALPEMVTTLFDGR